MKNELKLSRRVLCAKGRFFIRLRAKKGNLHVVQLRKLSIEVQAAEPLKIKNCTNELVTLLL